MANAIALLLRLCRRDLSHRPVQALSALEEAKKTCGQAK
jgi:hypothetical protein